MTREKHKVVIWRPFPSPTKREATAVRGMVSTMQPSKEESQRERDQAAVSRWIELADILNGKTKSKAKKRGAAA